MAVYSVSYDLNKVGQDYKSLYEQLKSSATWWHYLDSTWLIVTAETADQLSKRLIKVMDKNDNLLVIEVRNNHAGWLSEKAWEWIYEYIGR